MLSLHLTLFAILPVVFLPIATSQIIIHPMTTASAPAAALHDVAARAAPKPTTFLGRDCQGNFGPWSACLRPSLTEKCAGVNPSKATETVTASDWTCACPLATNLYNCYTRYCDTGPDFAYYYTAVSVCAANGQGKPPPAPTGKEKKYVKSNAAAGPGHGVKAGEVGLWAIWGLIATGTFVALLI
ncbi:hypothetical protein QBC35DRAFT_463481 [Podospora australis]|uniref:Uncharacterized protein n=1 Tax=Podospora australis TaxID=1536484 RepID=A0AAN7AJ37_9PEZI|nr:hypothetical protein QBC35DRAFT_463481 [Podospora australis]